MQPEKTTLRFPGPAEFDPDKVFDCGQCFRFDRDPEGVWRGIAGEYPAEIRWADGDLILDTAGSDPEAFWRDYLDLDRDYGAIRAALGREPGLREAAEFGRGIRILRQDPWEALCTFILSQCNNIPRIKGLVERLAGLFGREVPFGGRVYYTFPDAGRVAALEEPELAPVRCGFRGKYILAAARAVASGELDLEGLRHMSHGDALAALKTLPGVGDKVAGCTLLFGLGHLDAFPVDVWMRRAIADRHGGALDPGIFGGYAGIAQQYIFYHARWGGREPA